MYIKEEFLTSDFEDSNRHLNDMLKDALKSISNAQKYSKLDKYDLLHTYKIISDFCDLYNIDAKNLKVNGDSTNKQNIIDALNKFYANFITSAGNMSSNIFSKKMYSLTDNEYDNIQEKINKLRENLLNTEMLDEKHRERVLNKLEELQKELHKKMSSLDKFLGGMISIAHTLGVSAKEAKPFTNDVKDILDITLNAKSRGENLPEGNKQIENNEVLQLDNI